MGEQPLIVGHSMGGLITQLLLDRGYGVAGIALDPGPIAGALPGPVSLLAALPPIFAGPGTTHTISRDGFAKNFANTVPAAEQKAAYDAYVVPTPTNIFYQAAAMIGTGVKVKSRKQPLLVIAAEHNRTVTPYLVKAIYNVQKKSPARTDFHQFPIARISSPAKRAGKTSRNTPSTGPARRPPVHPLNGRAHRLAGSERVPLPLAGRDRGGGPQPPPPLNVAAIPPAQKNLIPISHRPRSRAGRAS